MSIIDLKDLSILEGDNSFQYAEFTVFLDAPATSAVTFSYYTQDGTASASQRDYDARSNTVTFAAGEQSKIIQIAINGDSRIEGNETFKLVVIAGANATLAGNAAALVATGTILDNDDGIADGPGGVGGPAQQLDGGASASTTLPTLSVHDVSVIEGNSGFEYARFLVTLDRPATANVTFSYYTQDGTASAANGDYDSASSAVTIQAGQQSTWINIAVDGDTAIEGNETFRLVLAGIRNGVFAGGAPALAATATIIGDDNGAPTLAGGVGDFGAGIDAQPSASALPTLSAHDVSIIEGSSGFEYARFLVTLDRPTNADVTFSYYTQDGTASAANGDYDSASNSVTIQAGQQSTWIGIPVYGDTAIEGNETFKLVLGGIKNGAFAGGAPALAATATIIDDDNGALTLAGGVGDFADGIDTQPSASATLPTLSVHDVSVIEGNSGFEYARFLVTLDRPATANVTFSYYTQDGTASAANGDYDSASNSVTIQAGQQSTWINIAVYGDTAIEGNETFKLVLTGIKNGVFADGAPALAATATIIDNDNGALAFAGGVGDFGAGIDAQPSASATLPTLSVHDTSVFEGNSGSQYARFLFTLDKPATSTITFLYSFQDGSASYAAGDYGGTYGTATIQAGQQSGWIQTLVYGDIAHESNETFQIVLSAISGAKFAYDAPALVATATIIEDDNGAPLLSGGIGQFGYGAEAPPVNGVGPVARIVSTSVNEGDSGDGYAYINVLLSEAATTQIRMDFTTQSGSAISGSDFDVFSGQLVFDPGERSSWVRIRVNGDNALEGDEAFKLIFSNILGASFENGAATAEANIVIRDNDGAGTAGSPLTGPEFVAISHGTPEADVLTGTPRADKIFGLAGNDTLNGGAGIDTMDGGAGDDTYFVDNALDKVIEAVNGGSDRVLTAVSYMLAADAEIELFTTTNTAGGGAINLTGNEFAQTIGGNAGANIIDGAGGADTMYGYGGNDTYYVDNALDKIVETANGGSDRALTSINYTLTAGAEIETLTTTLTAGTGALNLTGNELAQTIGGNNGANIIDGKGGADLMQGFGGNDIYYVDNAGDRAMEASGGGMDRVLASVSYTLTTGAEIETFTTTNTAGTSALNLTGNEFAQTIGGNAGANVINGMGGADLMQGFGGNDTYYVDNSGDRVIEAANGGSDRVLTSVNYTLTAGAEVETFTTTLTAGTGAINLTGNEFAQTIGGNAGANVINGMGGADLMQGFGGNDTYYVDNSGDRVIEAANGGSDRVLTSVNYTLTAGVQVETFTTTATAGTTAINLTGNEFAQVIGGNAGANYLDGKAGSDTLQGFGGHDSFAFTSALGSTNIDTIADFSVADDTILLAHAIFTGLGASHTLDADAFVIGSAAGDASDRIIYNSTTGNLYFDDDGSGVDAAQQFAHLSAGLALTNADFYVA